MACINLSDPSTSSQAKVTTRGQLVTSPLDFSCPIALCITGACVANNFFGPQAGKQLVVTDIFVHTDRTSPVGGSLIEIYESCSATSLTADKTIFKVDLGRQAGAIHTGLNFLITSGVWLNAKSDLTSGTNSITVAGYFVDV